MQAAYLEMKVDTGTKQVPLDGGPLTIGRNFTNLLVIEESMASRFHCVIEKVDKGFVVRDLKSRNGTLVNGKPVQSAELKHGDVVSIGKTQLKLIDPSAKPVRIGPPKQ